jgi:hypothetical protein
MALVAVVLSMLTPSTHHVNRWEVVRPYNAKLERMAMCESTGRWFINTGNGFFGGLQFTLQTWRGGRTQVPTPELRLEQVQSREAHQAGRVRTLACLQFSVGPTTKKRNLWTSWTTRRPWTTS